MFLNPLDQFFERQEEPNKSCLISLRQIIKDFDPNISEHWKYKLPFYYYKGRTFCYIWKDKKSKLPYIGMVRGILIDHPALYLGNRTRMKSLTIDPQKDIPLDLIYEIFGLAKKLY